MLNRLVRVCGFSVLMGMAASQAAGAEAHRRSSDRSMAGQPGYVEQVPNGDRELPPDRPVVRNPGYIDQVPGAARHLVPAEELEGKPADAYPDVDLVDESGFEWYRPVPEDVSAYARQIYMVPFPPVSTSLPRCLTTFTADQIVRLAPYCAGNR